MRARVALLVAALAACTRPPSPSRSSSPGKPVTIARGKVNAGHAIAPPRPIFSVRDARVPAAWVEPADRLDDGTVDAEYDGWTEPIDFNHTRFVDRRRIAGFDDRENAWRIFTVSQRKPARLARKIPAEFSRCEPLQPFFPRFACRASEEKAWSLVSLDTAGAPHVEDRVRFVNGSPVTEESYGVIEQTTGEGGVLIRGCEPDEEPPDGHTIETHCVRQPGGHWRRHALDLYAFFEHEYGNPTPLPRADGAMFVFGSDQKARGGQWIMLDDALKVVWRSELGRAPLVVPATDHVSFTWLTSRSLVIHTVKDVAPARDESTDEEHCAFIIDFDRVAVSERPCFRGPHVERAHRRNGSVGQSGRFDIYREAAGGVFETSDGGATWLPLRDVSAPKDARVRCKSIGCLIGGDRRFGWGIR